MKIAWVTTWNKSCGIATYSRALWKNIERELKGVNSDGCVVPLEEFPDNEMLARHLAEMKPDIVHFQHEYGIYGNKNPPGYRFPALVSKIRSHLPGTALIATAHTVLPPDYRFPAIKGGLRAFVENPARRIANVFFLPRLRKIWNEHTWGRLDGVIVHSSLQEATTLACGARYVFTIPHFVFDAHPSGIRHPALNGILNEEKVIVVFGYFTPEKGQHVAIQAMNSLPPDVRMILAGGTRRKEDTVYYEHCLSLARSLGVSDRITFTGFVPEDCMSGFFARADLVLAPFMATSGSGSLAQALARGAAVLASDLPLNLEIAMREPGALAFFTTGDADSCVGAIRRILTDDAVMERMRTAAKKYAQAYSPARIAGMHLEFYGKLLKL
ncbi:MAG: hypothetical protein A2583_09580 [Bdellovibrionales bacterium RIFOXYD1_FULL_53_11]|nr:MAG: hypothetical protein A2583_09580 [Bdellovibrionales bacterium RIFOXYD1_FULL_53_11]